MGVYKMKTKGRRKKTKIRRIHTTVTQYRVDCQHPMQIDPSMASCLMNKHKSSKLSAKVFGLRFAE